MVGYNTEEPGRREEIIDAQFAVANFTKYPEFAGTVAAVETRDFVRPPPPASPGDQGYHWNNNCESYWLVGEAMGKAMIDLLKGRVYHHGRSNDQAVTNLSGEKRKARNIK
jgi:hypothetical protein